MCHNVRATAHTALQGLQGGGAADSPPEGAGREAGTGAPEALHDGPGEVVQ